MPPQRRSNRHRLTASNKGNDDVKRILILFLLLVPGLASAEITPPKGPYDARVRVVDYNPLNVVRVDTFYGVSTDLNFGAGEAIKDVAFGDDQAWTAKPRGNHLFLKPKAKHASTNLTVVTSKRTYQFLLYVIPRKLDDPKAYADHRLVYALTFRYPDEVKAKLEAEAKAREKKAQADALNAKLADASKTLHNDNYWVKGSQEISPTGAYDDGRFIYLKFSNNRDMPAVYQVNAKGKESLINTNVIHGNTIVVQRLVKHLMLRKGDLVASVVNRSFDLDDGADNTTGTVSPSVQRVIKEGDQ